MQNQIRQGDVFLKPCKMPRGDKSIIEPIDGRLILAYGEVTGHHHSVSSEVAELFDFGGKTILVVNESSVVEHQEHAPIEIEPGVYWVVRQREYTPQEIRRVQD